ncbi:YbhB/YbcL family Raf kinase inhibitor-like protein [Roseivirga seohaensis]|uniref:YbhB/YbcL family Raf kinase inhibitor-like protein n=1 Tax=Roseivirga seohaensis TaxID=1914963 RepID=UPI003BA8D395
MKNRTIILFIALTALSFSGIAQNFTLSSKSLSGQATNKTFFNNFGCSGDNISPELSWSNPPEGTKSFAVTIYDADAPTGSGFWHWVVFNIPAQSKSISENASSKKSLPIGSIESNTDFGAPGYGGPCPPEGDKPHMFIVTVYALKTDKLGLDANATPAVVGFYLNANVIEKSSIVFYAKR